MKSLWNKRIFNIPVMLIIIANIGGIVILTTLILMFNDIVHITYNGFALDSNDNLYVGFDQYIGVFEKGEKIRKIDPLTNRGYYFTIENDILTIANTQGVVTMDLNGNIINSKKDENDSVYITLQNNRKKFTDDKGTSYKMVCIFGRTKIIRDEGYIVYQASTIDFVAKLLSEIVIVIFLILMAYYIVFIRRKEIADCKT